MEPIELAKCWSLDDGTACKLTKVSERSWELRVARGVRLLRVEVFADLALAVRTAARWRVIYASDAQIA